MHHTTNIVCQNALAFTKPFLQHFTCKIATNNDNFPKFLETRAHTTMDNANDSQEFIRNFCEIMCVCKRAISMCRKYATIFKSFGHYYS